MSTIISLLRQTKTASVSLLTVSDKQINSALKFAARLILKNQTKILKANRLDLKNYLPSDPNYDRALLNKSRLKSLAEQLVAASLLSSPINKILERRILSNKLQLSKITAPLGVIGVIYESRPNVTTEVFSLCLKAHNACLLKGGKEIARTNTILVNLIKQALKKFKISADVVNLAPLSRTVAKEMITARAFVDVIIPRGGRGLIDFVRQNSTVPIIETGAGVVHMYFDVSGSVNIGAPVISNAKTRRASVCNALDTLIIHRARLKDLPALVSALALKRVHLFADPRAYKILAKKYDRQLLHRAKKQNFGKEYLSLAMSIKTVNSIEEAVQHIALYGSKHSEAIIARSKAAINYFFTNVDAAALYSNTSTAFTDGGQFGLGGEIGISTQKLHARGPFSLAELTTYKWIVRGKGQVRMP